MWSDTRTEESEAIEGTVGPEKGKESFSASEMKCKREGESSELRKMWPVCILAKARLVSSAFIHFFRTLRHVTF